MMTKPRIDSWDLVGIIGWHGFLLIVSGVLYYALLTMVNATASLEAAVIACATSSLWFALGTMSYEIVSHRNRTINRSTSAILVAMMAYLCYSLAIDQEWLLWLGAVTTSIISRSYPLFINA